MGRQLELGFRTPRAKTKKKGKKRGRPRSSNRVAHRHRDVHPRRPLHVTLRVRREVWNLRSRRSFQVMERAFYACLGRFQSRIAHFSVQHNHVHLLVEAADRAELGRIMQKLCIRMALGMNKVMGRRKGTVFGDRYHSRSLKTPTETRAALVYVLQNRRKHLTQFGQKLSRDWIDLEYSSAEWFTGWAEPQPEAERPPMVATAKTWLLERGWHERGGGKMRREEVPAS